MPPVARVEVLDPATLSDAALDALTDRLYGVHAEIFDGVSRESFARYVVRSPAEQTSLQLSYGADGELAGYIAVHAFKRRFRGEPCTVLRAEAGLRRAYRGAGSPGSFFTSQLLRARVSSPGAQVYLGCLVHPSSYTALARDAAAIWPRPDAETPADVAEFMMALGEEFHLEMVDPARPLVREVGWITRDTPAERQYWLGAENPYARFYVEQNPGFVRGDGLLTLIPLDMGTLGRSLVSWGRGRLEKSLFRTVGALERNVLRPSLDERQAEGLLQQVERATGLELDAVRDFGIVGARYPVPARTVLMREGEPGQELFLIVSGAVQVIRVGAGGEEEILDQLGPGNIVGEMAVATGRPRTATARTATDCVLLRLTRPEVDGLHAAAPALLDLQWWTVGARIFDTLARAVPGLEALSPQARKRWASEGELRALDEGALLALEEGRILVLITGRVVAAGAQGFLSLEAPAVLTLSPGLRLRATTAARLLLLPLEPSGEGLE